MPLHSFFYGHVKWRKNSDRMALTSLDKKNQYALLTINRPEALNALNEDILSEIHEHVESLNSDKAMINACF